MQIMGTLQYGIISRAIFLTEEKPMGERLQTASLNTLLGMGIVFAVLILIILTIYLFRIVPYLQGKSQNNKNNDNTTSVDNAIAHIVEQEEQELRDDNELVAVITAAIYASMKEDSVPIPSDGLVVRSIRRINSIRRVNA